MKAYVDSSVIVALVLAVTNWDAISDWLFLSTERRLFSNFGWGEFADAVARKVRSREIAPDSGMRAFEGGRTFLDMWARIAVTPQDVDAAADFICDRPDRDLKFPDAVHIAICLRLGATLVTNDRQQAVAARSLKCEAILATEL